MTTLFKTTTVLAIIIITGIICALYGAISDKSHLVFFGLMITAVAAMIQTYALFEDFVLRNNERERERIMDEYAAFMERQLQESITQYDHEATAEFNKHFNRRETDVNPYKSKTKAS